jgi:hypothetical protein
MDIVISKDGICTLTNVVIVNPIQTNLLSKSRAIQGFVAFDAAQTKKKSYYNRQPISQFLPLAIEVFGCLQKQINVFLHDYANAI